MKIIKVNELDELFKILRSFPNHYVYRGQADARWDLNSALDRICAVKKRINYEVITFQEFKKNAVHYLKYDQIPVSKLGWLSLMQHHGIPTRLIDFSESPFIALFFAISPVLNFSEEVTECAIYCLNYRHLMNINKEKAKLLGICWDVLLVDKNDNLFDECAKDIYNNIVPSLCLCLEPSLTNLRLHRQQGTFIFSSNIQKSLQETLCEDYYSDLMIKIIFPVNLKYEIYNTIRLMNINYSNLYCDIDGLSKDIVNRMNYEMRYK